MLQLKSVSFGYNKTPFINDISFKLNTGEQLAIIGESGSGKTTLLKLIYGEYDLFSGSIFWKDTEIKGPSYNLVIGYEFMKMVSQEFDLMPFVTVQESVGKYLSNFFPLKKKKRVAEILEVVGLDNYSNSPLTKLSGGQKQRVALARALANEPEILLLDEPFSHIDSFKKQHLRRRLFRYLRENNISCVVATHDKDDVLGFADEVVVLENGEVLVKKPPIELFNNPPNTSVAAFFGEYNLIDPADFGLKNAEDSETIIYAHQLKISSDPNIEVTVEYTQFNGSNYLIEAVFNGRNLFFYSEKPLEKGQTVGLKLIE